METSRVMSEDLYRVIQDALVTSAYVGNPDWDFDVTGYGIEKCLAIKFEYVSDFAEFIFRVRDLCPVVEEDWCKGIQHALYDVDRLSDETIVFKHLVTKQQVTKTIGIGGYEV